MSRPLKVRKRIFDEGSVEELQYNINKESWKEVLLDPDLNGNFDAFMNILHYHFDRCFPLKLVNQSRLQKKSWITQGIRKSSERLHWLNRLQKEIDLTVEQVYTHKYRLVYKRIIKGAKKKENDRHIASAKNKTKAIWQIVNKDLETTYKRKREWK
jgi:hypothetical protein